MDVAPNRLKSQPLLLVLATRNFSLQINGPFPSLSSTWTLLNGLRVRASILWFPALVDKNYEAWFIHRGQGTNFTLGWSKPKISSWSFKKTLGGKCIEHNLVILLEYLHQSFFFLSLYNINQWSKRNFTNWWLPTGTSLFRFLSIVVTGIWMITFLIPV